MSLRYKGGVISATPPTTSTTSASGNWTLEQQMQAQGAGTWPFGGPFNYIEDVFQTWLYKGNSSTQTITNGIDLSTYGGLVWAKDRTYANSHQLYDTARGVQKRLMTDQTAAQGTETTGITAFNSNGWTMGAQYEINDSASNYASWTFRKQAKFFDVVTFTAPASGTITVNHNLGSVPGCVITKSTGISQFWIVNHRSLSSNQYLILNTADSVQSGAISYTATSTTITFSAGYLTANQPYVMYLFAHNAGGFGLTGTDNVISCGSFTVNGSGDCSVSLGYEPQWLMVKSSTAIDNWYLYDNMRGFPVAPSDGELLRPNTSQAGITGSTFRPTSTGFVGSPGTGFGTGIYIAIRRGPMKTPTSGTSVFNPNAYTATGVGNRNFTDVGFSPDWSIFFDRSNAVGNSGTNMTKLIGPGVKLQTTDTSAQNTGVAAFLLASFDQLGYTFGASTGGNGQLNGANGDTKVFWNFGRAPGFFDVVCYTGNGSTQTITHNLGVVPELIIAKNRGQAGNNWPVLFNFSSTNMNYGFLNLTNSCPNDTYANVGVFSAAPTSTSMFLVNSSSMNGSGFGIVAYLFASCPGVSKVGSYTGTGATQTINCGFTGGARWVMIKRTDSTGDWYVWDTARGMVSGTDPSLLLNSTAAEVNANSVYTTSVGFQIVSTAAGINASGGSYIFLAIA